MAADGLDVLVITKNVNVRWLTGFVGSNGAVLVAADALRLVTDGRYAEQARLQLAEAGVIADLEITTNSFAESVRRFAAGSARIGFEADHLTWTRLREIQELISGSAIEATSQLIEGLRRHKDAGERARLEQAAAIADRSLIETVGLLGERPSEQFFAAELDHRMRRNGADDVSFETIVASGPNSALPHHRPGLRIIEPGDLVVIDFGAKVDGYGSDMTRTFVVGGTPTDAQRKLYEAVVDAQAAGVAAVRAGVDQRSIDTRCRAVLAEHGLAEAFTHGTGHGLGLEIHEQPILSARSVGILPAGLIVTVEPGAYLVGFGGVRIEDTVVVTETGCDPITHCPKSLDPRDLDRLLS
jgi:Xaa-Pro aminopeptidase